MGLSSKVNIIGLGHYSGVGKDTAANLLKLEAESEGINCSVLSFASPIKELCQDYFHHLGVECEDHYNTKEGRAKRSLPLKRTNIKNVVELWVSVGNYFRQINPDVWIEALNNRLPDSGLVVIPDVRFLNEVDWIQSKSGKCIKMVREGIGPLPTKSDNALIEFTGWDSTIDNSGSLSDLKDQIKDIYENTH